AQAALALLPGRAGWSLKNWLLILFGVGFLSAGAVGWQAIPSVPATPSSPPASSDAVPGPLAARAAPAPAGPVVVGEVSDAAGKPVPNADVVVLTGGTSEPSRPPVPGRTVGGGRGGGGGGEGAEGGSGGVPATGPGWCWGRPRHEDCRSECWRPGAEPSELPPPPARAMTRRWRFASAKSNPSARP